MIDTVDFYKQLTKRGINFLSGVPDSLLKNISACFTDQGNPENHIIAVNEGNAIGIAAGYHMATGNIPLVYMQNSGLGNTVNPLLSLASPAVYGIPMLLLIGWRGEPGVKDEPQHVKQGALTLPLLDTLEIPYKVLSPDTENFSEILDHAISTANDTSSPYALVVRKNTFSPYNLEKTNPDLSMIRREKAIAMIASAAGDGVLLSTTGHISRELYEYRKTTDGICSDFLNVGSMGHVSQIAMGVALSQPRKRVFCLDGDGAALMHMGSLGIIASKKPKNFHHVIFNNGVHGSVGGQPTIGARINFAMLAKQLGYRDAWQFDDEEKLSEFLNTWPDCDGPTMLEIRVSQSVNKDLGRPKESPLENKHAFMNRFRENT